MVANFFAFEPVFKGGVYVAAGKDDEVSANPFFLTKFHGERIDDILPDADFDSIGFKNRIFGFRGNSYQGCDVQVEGCMIDA